MSNAPNPSHDDPTNEPQELLRRWSDEGDVDALSDLLRIELDPVKRHFRASVGERWRTPTRDTTDFVSEAMGNLLRQIEPPRFDGPAGLRAYLATAAVNLYRNHYHRGRRREEEIRPEHLANIAAEPAPGPEREEFWSSLMLAFDLLPDGDRSLLHEHLIEGRSVRDIATIRAVPRSTVADGLLRARANLMRRMMSWREWLDS